MQGRRNKVDQLYLMEHVDRSVDAVSIPETEIFNIHFLSAGWTLLMGRQVYDDAMEGERG